MGQGASAEASPCQAASRGDVVAVEQWLRAGGDPNAVHKSLKSTALQAAARGDHVECLELLLRNGADINVATVEGTALHAAASRCCHRAVSLLLRWGANPAATNATGMTAAEVAENMGYANLAREIRQQASSSSSAQRAGSLEAAAVAKPAAGGRETAPPQQQQQRPGSPAAQTSLSRTSHESASGQVAGQPAPTVPAVAAGAAAPQAPPRPYAQQWPAAQPQPVAPSQARPQHWPATQQPASQPQAHPPQWAGVQQPYASALQPQPQPQQQPQQQAAAGWPSFGQPGQASQPAAQPAAVGWGAAAAGAPPPQAQRPERPLKWWQQPQNQPPPPVAHSHPAYQAWLQQQVAAQQAQQGYHTQQAQQAHGMYGAPTPYPPGYGSGYATQPAAPAGFAYQLNPATGGWVLVPAAAGHVPAAGAVPYYPSLQPVPPQRAQQVPAQQPAEGALQHPAAAAAAAPQPTPSSLAGGSTAACPAPAALPLAAVAGGATAAAAAAKQQAAQQASLAAAPASTPATAVSAAAAASGAAVVGSAASAPAELLLAEAAGDEHFEDINSGGSLMPSPSAPPATNSLLDRLFAQPEWQPLESSAGEAGGSSGAAPTAGGGSSSGGDSGSGSGGASSTAGAAAAAAGKGTAGAAAPLAQPSEGGSPKGTIEAMVALGLADSGVTDDQEQQLQEGVAAAIAVTGASGASNAVGSSAATDAAAAAAAAGRAGSGGGAAAAGGSQGGTAAQSGGGSGTAGTAGSNGTAGAAGSAAGTGAAVAAAGGSQADRLVSQASGGSGERRVGVLRSNASCMVDISPWEVKWEELRKQGNIGEGAFGAVYKAVWHETQVAVKVVGELQRAQEAAGPEAQLLSSPILQNLRLECGLMASMRHPNVVQFLGVCACPPAIVTEYCSRGSLTHVLQEGLKSPQKAALLTWQRRLRMAMDAAKGMLYLHKRGIVHRDFKSPNLLVDASWVVKVADFNLSKVTEGAALNPSSTMGNVNPRWLAPEILEEHPATFQSDVYAFGITMWELMTWQLPWGNAQIWTIMGQVMSGNRPPLPEPSAYSDLPGPGPFPCLPAWMALMQRCWHQDPGQRPDFAAIIAQLREIQAMAAGSQGGGGTAQRQASTS